MRNTMWLDKITDGVAYTWYLGVWHDAGYDARKVLRWPDATYKQIQDAGLKDLVWTMVTIFLSSNSKIIKVILPI